MSDTILTSKATRKMLELAARRVDEIGEACYERVTRRRIVQATTGAEPDETMDIPKWGEISPLEREIHREYAMVAMKEIIQAAAL